MEKTLFALVFLVLPAVLPAHARDAGPDAAQASAAASASQFALPLRAGESPGQRMQYPEPRTTGSADIRTSLPGLTVRDALFEEQLRDLALREKDLPRVSPVVRPDPSPAHRSTFR